MSWLPQIGDRIRITESEYSDPGQVLEITELSYSDIFDGKKFIENSEILSGFTCGGVYFNIDNNSNQSAKYIPLSVERSDKLEKILG